MTSSSSSIEFSGQNIWNTISNTVPRHHDHHHHHQEESFRFWQYTEESADSSEPDKRPPIRLAASCPLHRSALRYVKNRQ